ncbi:MULTISPECIES: nucleoside 2-deoxyribosyltransferase [unclassified Methanoregula]|uniref:nucleoside 2-deoxyribosyltransferase n=1 Tax=unclassified Methanoregula TaxID=2649730 RepID=UPI0009D049A9|nr:MULTISPECIES: nucleoside 2-deoxyribosyltransferase [unclassified Methanoregula]OPX64334.1 MAG: Nucleoside 2-deoxyribosyltransferase [Methanoregula sp. PtaB.Bin085]OPY33541.1 MAG: Nucleoside 2-deoxyribosyltransferase [Methanoregula sp. PtaU1.Bin006]
MYVLCSPCVLNPALRAEGITRQSDLDLFRQVIARCDRFGIGIVPLPCPETLYLGQERKPGTFLERLNTPAFMRLMDRLDEGVNDIIRERGPPLCIIGVNSSPTCGVTSTYYGEEAGRPAKREGRGVFLSRLPEIPAFDVAVFARYRVYLAAPLFSEAERSFNASVARTLGSHLFDVHLPQETGDDCDTRDIREQERLFSVNKTALDTSDFIVAIIDGADADSGTAWEMGYAFARGKPVIALRTDFRRVGHHEQVNLMLEQSAKVVGSVKEVLAALNSPCLKTESR